MTRPADITAQIVERRRDALVLLRWRGHTYRIRLWDRGSMWGAVAEEVGQETAKLMRRECEEEERTESEEERCQP